MTSRHLRRNDFATIFIAIAVSLFNLSAYAAQASSNEGASKVHPVDETKKAAKAIGHGVKKTTKVIGHGFRDGARAVGHGAKKVTQKVGHAFRDGAHGTREKKD